MFKSYFITGLRSLLKQKGYSAIKIAGLALGLTASMVIFLFIQEDLSYDRFHHNYDRIVRLLTIDKAEGVSSKVVGVTAPPLGPAVETELPEVMRTVRFLGGGQLELSYGEKFLRCDAGFRTESSFFEIFDFPILDGKKSGTLDEPNSIAITPRLAKRLFGTENPIGKTVKLNQATDLHVVAIVADPPANSHLQFDLLRSFTPGQNEEGYRQFINGWGSIAVFTYALLDRPLDEKGLNSKLKAIATKNNAVDFFDPIAQPLSDVHLRSKDILFETNANKSDALNVYILSVIAILILVLAAVNFMNLVTAKSTTRAKEVGLRKVIGALRHQLIGQHLAESLLVTIISALLATGLTFLLVPWLNSVYNRVAVFNTLLDWQHIAFMIMLIVVVGTLAGLYPAFVLSGFKPAQVLKGSFSSSAGGIRLRKALVVLQFTISIGLMVGTGIVYQQMRYIYTADLGYDRDQVITLSQTGNTTDNSQALKNELLRNPNVLSVGSSSTRIGEQIGRTAIVPEGYPADVNIISSVISVDDTFLPAMGMEIIDGRNFSLEFADSTNMLINEELAKLLKWNDPVGKKISFPTGPQPTDLTAYTVVGLVKDFHFATIRHKLEPLLMLYTVNNPSLAVKLKAGSTSEALRHVEETWRRVNPASTFEYAFLDDQFAYLYRNEQAFATMSGHFAILALVIAGLGLFALSAYTAELRKKELGIRKVLGASNASIFFKLSSEFVILIAMAFVLASAGAWYVMTQWLSDFQYSITIGPGIFLAAGFASLLIALLTVSFQAVRAAVANPVDSLRSE